MKTKKQKGKRKRHRWPPAELTQVVLAALGLIVAILALVTAWR